MNVVYQELSSRHHSDMSIMDSFIEKYVLMLLLDSIRTNFLIFLIQDGTTKFKLSLKYKFKIEKSWTNGSNIKVKLL